MFNKAKRLTIERQGCCLIKGRFTKLNFTSIKVLEYLVTWICLEKLNNYV